MVDRFCESCGSNIEGQELHLCSIMTARGWRQEIPLHARARPLLRPVARIEITDRGDWELYRAWLEQHQASADALVVDKRTGLVIQAIYGNHVALNVSERVDFWTNAQRLAE